MERSACQLSKEIRNMYRRAGLVPPDGKGIHTKLAHKIVIEYLKKGLSKDEAWKRAVGALRERAIKRAHRHQKIQ